MAQHADCGPSYSPIYTKCPASVTKARGMKGTAGPSAIRGTALHTGVELALQGQPIPDEIDVDGVLVPIGPDEREAIDACVSVGEIIRETSSEFELEKWMTLDWMDPPEPVSGTTDLKAFSEATGLLTVVDWKFGRMDVQPDGPQALEYILMAMGEIGLGRVKTVRSIIVQPAQGDRAVKAVEMTPHDVLRWAEMELMPALDRIAAGDETETPGDHCKYCRRGAECAALQERSLTVAKAFFDDVPEAQLRDEELGEILTKAEMVEAWIAHVRAEVDRRLREGGDVPGWKLVPKKAQRKWNSPEMAMETFGGILGPDAFVQPTMKSPAQMEKALKNAGFDPKVVEPLVTRESSGATLVPATDPREAVKSLPGAAYFD